MDESISGAILKILNECGPGRSLRLDPLTGYANAHTTSYVDRNQIQAHVNDLERRGLVRHEASPLNQNVFSYSITAAGQALAAALH